MDIQRKAFESAMQELSGGQTKNDVNPVTGEYQYGVMQVMWSVWQKAQAVPEVKLSHCVTLTCATAIRALNVCIGC